MSVQINPVFRKKLETFARAEKRTVENQAICLIESGIKVFEEGKKYREVIL